MVFGLHKGRKAIQENLNDLNALANNAWGEALDHFKFYGDQIITIFLNAYSSVDEAKAAIETTALDISKTCGKIDHLVDVLIQETLKNIDKFCGVWTTTGQGIEAMLPWGKVILGSGAAAFILFALRQVQKIVSGYNQLPAIEYSNNNNSVSTYVHYDADAYEDFEPPNWSPEF